MIHFENVNVGYDERVDALSHLSLTIHEGEYVYVIGKTGAGKSTLIKLLNDELKPASGTINCAGYDLNSLTQKDSYLYRRKLGIVFQNLRFLPKKTIRENLFFVGTCVCNDEDVVYKRIDTVSDLVGLKDRLDAFPNELSGGQLQRMAIARAIMNKPEVLIADEPTANLDPQTKYEILNLLEWINQNENTTTIVVTHDTAILKTYPHHTFVLDRGRLIGDFSKEDVIQCFNR